MPSKSIPLWRLQKYKKWVTPHFDIPDALAVTPTPSRPADTCGKGAAEWEQSGAWRGDYLLLYNRHPNYFALTVQTVHFVLGQDNNKSPFVFCFVEPLYFGRFAFKGSVIPPDFQKFARGRRV